MTGTWRGMDRRAADETHRLPRSVSAANPSRSPMSVNTDIIGGGLPAARAATSSRTRAQSRTRVVGAAEVARQVGLAEPDRRHRRVGGDRRRRLEPAGASRSGP